MWTRLCPSLSLWCPLSKQMLGTSWKGCLNFQPCGNRYLAKCLSLSLALSLSLSLSLSLFLYIYIYTVSVRNISLHFQTFIVPLVVIIQCDFCLNKESDNSQCSTQRSDLIIIQSVWNRDRTNWDRLNPEELWQCLQDASRDLRAKLPEKTMHKCNLGKSWFKRKGWSHQMFSFS